MEGVMGDEHGFEEPVVIKTKTCSRACLHKCPFADLFRTTFPKIRGNRAQEDYLFGKIIEN
jgi:hypothetical protein